MSIVSNRNTTQKGMSNQGRTGDQVVKFIPAPRVYVTSPASQLQSILPLGISNGSTPYGYTDLGSVIGSAKVTYNRKVKEVMTGIDNYFRGAYTNGSTSMVEFELEQLDDVALETISGLTSSVVTAGSVVNYQIGQNDLIPLSILLVVQNKFDGKEFQYFNPAALVNFSFNESSDAMSLKCTAYLPYFTAAGQTQESSMSVTIFNANTTPLAAPTTSSLFGGSAFGQNAFGA